MIFPTMKLLVDNLAAIIAHEFFLTCPATISSVLGTTNDAIADLVFLEYIFFAGGKIKSCELTFATDKKAGPLFSVDIMALVKRGYLFVCKKHDKFIILQFRY